MRATLRIIVTQVGILMLAFLPLACESSSPTSPSSTNITGGSSGAVSASVTAAEDGSTLKVSAPVAGSPIADAEVETLRPTLTVTNAQGSVVTGIAFTHEFMVYHVEPSGNLTIVESGTAAQGDATTSYTLQAALEDQTSHQWKARAFYQKANGPWSEMAGFRTNVPVSISAPLPLDPSEGQLVVSLRPIFQVGNPQEIRGDPGVVTIEFQIATDPAFDGLVAVFGQEMGTHSSGLETLLPDILTSHLREQRTSTRPKFDLETETSYFWRARATNGSVQRFPVDGAMAVVTSEFTDVRSFTTPSAVTSGTGEDQLDLSQVVWLHTNVSGWTQSSTVTSTRIGDPPICIDHTKSGEWPVVTLVNGTRIEGNPWVFAKVNGTWYGATYEWLRPGQTCKQLRARDLGPHVKVAPLSGWKPDSGEVIGLMVSTPARFGPDGPKNERSNVVLVTWP